MAYKIVTVTEGTLLNPDGTFTRTRIVRYTVNNQGPFQLEIPAEEFTAAEVTRRVEAQAREIEGALGGS